jgi:hypothetical protein
MRLLVLRSVELVASLKKNKAAQAQVSALFTRIMDMLDSTLAPNQFAALLLSLARQLRTKLHGTSLSITKHIDALSNY